jgi:hypothetical protein
MTYWSIVENVVRKADVVLVVLDARMPEQTRNKELERKISRMRKKLILVFNKIDLVSKDALNKLKKEYPGSFFISASKNIDVARLRTRLFILAGEFGREELKVGVVGYPNVGKSAVINVLARRAGAKVAQTAGTTRGVQWITTSRFKILDTPGVIPYGDDEMKLGIIGSRDPEQLRSPEGLALEIIKIFFEKNRKKIEEYAKMALPDDAYDALLEIGKKRGYLKKGGIVDETRTAITIIRDWQKGKLRL